MRDQLVIFNLRPSRRPACRLPVRVGQGLSVNPMTRRIGLIESSLLGRTELWRLSRQKKIFSDCLLFVVMFSRRLGTLSLQEKRVRRRQRVRHAWRSLRCKSQVRSAEPASAECKIET